MLSRVDGDNNGAVRSASPCPTFSFRSCATLAVFTGALELDLERNALLKSRKTRPAADSPTAAVLPKLAEDSSATQILDLVLHSDQHLRPTANELVKFVVELQLPEAAASTHSEVAAAGS